LPGRAPSELANVSTAQTSVDGAMTSTCKSPVYLK